MKTIFGIGLIVGIACVAQQQSVLKNDAAAISIAATDSTDWTKSFSAFRTAILQWDKATIKSHFDFPVMSEHNQIWLLIYQGQQKDDLSADPKPFTEKDFDTYAAKLFPKTFRNILLKVKTAELKKKGDYETTSLRFDKSTTYKMYATVDNGTRILTLSLAFHRVLKNAKGEVEDNEEYGTVYSFNILPNGTLKFAGVALTA